MGRVLHEGGVKYIVIVIVIVIGLVACISNFLPLATAPGKVVRPFSRESMRQISADDSRLRGAPVQ